MSVRLLEKLTRTTLPISMGTFLCFYHFQIFHFFFFFFFFGQEDPIKIVKSKGNEKKHTNRELRNQNGGAGKINFFGSLWKVSDFHFFDFLNNFEGKFF